VELLPEEISENDSKSVPKTEKSISVELLGEDISGNHENHRKSSKINQKCFTTIHSG
jgi:hypothetical protein